MVVGWRANQTATMINKTCLTVCQCQCYCGSGLALAGLLACLLATAAALVDVFTSAGEPN